MYFSPCEVLQYFQGGGKKYVWAPPAYQKACSTKGVLILHVSILIAMEKLNVDVIFTG